MDQIQFETIDQHGTRWSGEQLGFSDFTIGTHGSLLACFAMLAGTDPYHMNLLRRQHGGYGEPEQRSGKAVNFDIRHEARKATGRQVEMVYISGLYQHLPFPEAEIERIRRHVNDGQPAILEMDVVPAGSEAETHFVLAVRSQCNLDPWDGMVKRLWPDYGCRLDRIINRAILYEVAHGNDIKPTGDADRVAFWTRPGRNRYERE